MQKINHKTWYQNQIQTHNSQKTITTEGNHQNRHQKAQFGRPRAQPATQVQMEKSETMRTKNESGRRSQKDNWIESKLTRLWWWRKRPSVFWIRVWEWRGRRGLVLMRIERVWDWRNGGTTNRHRLSETVVV